MLRYARGDVYTVTSSTHAEYVGFRDPDYFGKVFKRTMGCTVSEYREKRRQEEQR